MCNRCCIPCTPNTVIVLVSEIGWRLERERFGATGE